MFQVTAFGWIILSCMDGNLVDIYKYVTTCYIVILRSETPDSRNGLQAAMCFVLADLILRYCPFIRFVVGSGSPWREATFQGCGDSEDDRVIARLTAYLAGVGFFIAAFFWSAQGIVAINISAELMTYAATALSRCECVGCQQLYLLPCCGEARSIDRGPPIYRWRFLFGMADIELWVGCYKFVQIKPSDNAQEYLVFQR